MHALPRDASHPTAQMNPAVVQKTSGRAMLKVPLAGHIRHHCRANEARSKDIERHKNTHKACNRRVLSMLTSADLYLALNYPISAIFQSCTRGTGWIDVAFLVPPLLGSS